MNWVQFAVQWLHVLFAIAWFGTVIGINVVVMPRVMKMAPDRQREFMQGFLSSKAPHVFGLVTIALGLIRGTLLGPIQSIDFLFGTAYGRTWFVAITMRMAPLGILGLLVAFTCMILMRFGL